MCRGIRSPKVAQQIVHLHLRGNVDWFHLGHEIFPRLKNVSFLQKKNIRNCRFKGHMFHNFLKITLLKHLNLGVSPAN